MSTPDWKPVANALLGTWPTRVAIWGKEGIAAYLAELGARGVSPDQALVAIRSYDPDADFPPSVAKLAQSARKDPAQPVFAEVIVMLKDVLGQRTSEYKVIWKLGEREQYDKAAMYNRADQLHPLCATFIARQGISRLRGLDLDGEWGEATRKRLSDEWDRHVDAMSGREVALLVAGRGRGELGRVDPLSALGSSRVALESGIEAGTMDNQGRAI